MTQTLPDWSSLQPGTELPTIELPPITRHTLALYCGASGDHNPIHVDIDFAQSAGMPDVFAHGMLSAAWLARVLTAWVPQSAIRSLDIRFAAITHVGERISCSGVVTEKLVENGRRIVKVQLKTVGDGDVAKLTGEAQINWP
jgi:acyl dehydratase